MKFFSPLFLLVCSFTSAANVNVGGALWAEATNADGTGYYFELVSKALPGENIVFHTDAFNRVINNFHHQKIDVMVGVFREETPNAVFPNWYLDIEYPIVGFYNPAITELKHIADLSNLSVSWLRGYQFERFLTEVDNPYLVNTIESGFNLLTNNRINVFVDYEYNLPVQYKATLSHLELAPSRPIYVAFQNTSEGRRLAHLFDKNIEKMRDSGELERLFGNEYSHTQFASFNPKNKKIFFLTQDANLLKPLNDKNYFPVVSKLLHGIIEQTTNYNIELKLIPDYADLDKLPTNESYCISNIFKTPAREALFNYSQPFALYLGLQLYSLIPLDNQKAIDLPAFMARNKDKTIGIAHGQSYGNALDRQISKISDSQKVRTPAKTSMAMLSMLNKEVDFLLAYPSVVNLIPEEKRPKYSYPLKGNDDFSITYIMCNKNEASDEFLNVVNKILSEQYPSEAFFNIQYSTIEPAFRQVYTDKFNQVFQTSH